MKKYGKILLALLTASCLIASVFGLTACNNDPTDGPGPDPKPEPDVPLKEAPLSDGLNTITFTDTNELLCTYTAATAGRYAFVGVGEGAAFNWGDTPVTSYVVTLEEGGKTDFKCTATSDGVSYSVYAGKATELTVGSDTTVAVPAYESYAMLTVTVGSAGSYSVGFSHEDDMTEYTLIASGETSKASSYNAYAPVVTLEAGQNVIVLTSNVHADDVSGKQVAISVSAAAESGEKTLSVGDNTVNANYFGVEYTFTAPEAGSYTFSIDTTNENIFVDINSGHEIGYELDASYAIVLNKDDQVTVNCMTNEQGNDTYNINIAKSASTLESSGTIELWEEKQFGVDGSNNTTVSLQNAEAGTYYITVYGLKDGDTISVKVNGGTAQSATATLNGRGTAIEAMTSYKLEAENDLEIVITSPAGINSITVYITYYEPEVTE